MPVILKAITAFIVCLFCTYMSVIYFKEHNIAFGVITTVFAALNAVYGTYRLVTFVKGER